MKRKIVCAALLLVLFLSFIFSLGWRQKQSQRRVNIDLFLMSQCPFATQVENTLYMLSQRLGDKIHINFYFIANTDGKGNLNSIHGPAEVEEDARQLVIYKFYHDKFWKYLNSRNTEYYTPDWQPHAYMAGIDVEELRNLVNAKGKELLSENIKNAKALNVTSSPTIYIDGQLYQKSRSFASLVLLLAKKSADKKLLSSLPVCFSDSDCMEADSIGICKGAATLNAKCEPLEVALKIVDVKGQAYLSDKTYNMLKYFLPSLKESFVDYQSEEGKYFIKKTSSNALPVYLISTSVGKIKNLEQALAPFIPAGGNRIVYNEVEYSVLSNTMDKIRFYLTRKRILNKMDLFVMSQCPFGAEAEQIIYPIAKKEGIDLSIHYIVLNASNIPAKQAQQKPLEMASLHGAAELEEDMRQLCVKEHSPQNYFDYILARNKNFNSTFWEKVVEGTLGKGKAEVIRNCQYGKGEALLRENALLAGELRIENSPTILWENQRRFNNLEELKTGLVLFKDIEIKMQGSCGSNKR